MSFISALGLMTAILCTGWVKLAGIVGLLGWAGFSGCTSYFACPDKGLAGVKSCMFSTMSGAAYALLSIKLGSYFAHPDAGLFFTLVFTYLMCVQNRFKIFSYIPGTFFGSFSTFAAGGSILIIPSLLLGILLGVACDKSGQWLFQMVGKPETPEASVSE